MSDVLSEMGSNFASEWKALNVVAKVTWRSSHANGVELPCTYFWYVAKINKKKCVRNLIKECEQKFIS